MTISRRDLLRRSALTGAGLAVGGAFSGLALGGTAAAGPNGYGGLRSDAAGILELPRGFKYEILQKGGHGHDADFTTYDDGQKLAGDADGAASFAIGGNRTVIVTNHELSGGSDSTERVPMLHAGSPVPTYDPAAPGGTSNIVLDRKNRVASIYPSIAGTYNNCAGGPTPWGTWLTCEETTTTLNGVPHGYIFEVDPEGTRTVATPYKAMGRFAHEAVAIDPRDSVAYMTEDNNNGLIYRFVPDDTSMEYGSLGNGGTVSAMKVDGLAFLGEVKVVGTTLGISWAPVPGGNPDVVGLNGTFADGDVTRSRKLEGCWWGDDERFYFSSADENRTGIAHHGQIWALDPVSSTVTLVAYIPEDDPVFDAPDNITVAPNGQLFLCEDGGGEQYIIGCDPATGALWPFARNAMNGSEFAGANFSPDGKTMFVNVQNPSTTFAITGPWGAVRAGQSR
ncbi:MAG: DUF839 domain-containing protein [Acidimicrobiales bacterium]|nr:DUF839 domain-containing protein [Acidimicrobiales bacterium]